ncbi:hypothetical protein T439DRAFT_327046 [Meredithblackwellia eburnea MCA 4105]
MWYHKAYYAWPNPYAAPLQGMSGVASAAAPSAAGAAGTAAHAAQAAASTAATGAGAGAAFIPPHVPHGGPGPYPYGPHYSNPHFNYSHFYRRARGPRMFFPLLVVGGGVWGYHHLKHNIWDVRDELNGLKRVVFAQQQAAVAAASEGGVAVAPVVVPEPEPTTRRRRWERRWGDKGENVATVTLSEKLV